MIKEGVFSEIMASPQDYFNTPKDVVADNKLAISEKIKILENWKSESIHLSESTGEGLMKNNPSKRTRLSSIVAALDLLKA